MQCASVLGEQIGDKVMASTARDCLRRLERHHPDCAGNSQAAALAIIAGMSTNPQNDAKVILDNGVDAFSTFYGYYMLEALAQTGHMAEAQEMMKQYWGAMLDLGATTFWEDLSYPEVANAGRIDQIVPDGKYDIHADGGAYCYKGLRLSLCHGWASGPTSWLSRNVLGVKPLTPGCAQVEVKPTLGNLVNAEGDVPTPQGPIHVKAWKDKRGKTQCLVEAPEGVKVETDNSFRAQR